jgi:hypothetical protein
MILDESQEKGQLNRNLSIRYLVNPTFEVTQKRTDLHLGAFVCDVSAHTGENEHICAKQWKGNTCYRDSLCLCIWLDCL